MRTRFLPLPQAQPEEIWCWKKFFKECIRISSLAERGKLLLKMHLSPLKGGNISETSLEDKGFYQAPGNEHGDLSKSMHGLASGSRSFIGCLIEWLALIPVKLHFRRRVRWPGKCILQTNQSQLFVSSEWAKWLGNHMRVVLKAQFSNDAHEMH